MCLGSVEIGVKDFKLNTGAKIDKSTLGCFIDVEGRALDVILFNDPRGSVKIPLVKLHEIVRLTVKTLGSVEKKLGSVSFEKSLFLETSKPKQVVWWVTLFDDSSDDLYDGNFDEDDPETPMVQMWFKKADEVSRTVTTTTVKTIVTTTIERNENWNVSKVWSDLKGKLSSLISSLQDD